MDKRQDVDAEKGSSSLELNDDSVVVKETQDYGVNEAYKEKCELSKTNPFCSSL